VVQQRCDWRVSAFAISTWVLTVLERDVVRERETDRTLLSDADGWEDRWVTSTFKGGDEGTWDTTAGKYYGDANNKGLHTTTDYRWCTPTQHRKV